MPDAPPGMKEFLFLDAKRKVAGLSHAEEKRWLDLGRLLKADRPKALRSSAPVNSHLSSPTVSIPRDWEAHRAAQRRAGVNGLTYPTESANPLPQFGADAAEPTFGLAPPAGYEPPPPELPSAPRIATESVPLSEAPEPQLQAGASDVLEVDPADVVLLDPGSAEPSTAKPLELKPSAPAALERPFTAANSLPLNTGSLDEALDAALESRSLGSLGVDSTTEPEEPTLDGGLREPRVETIDRGEAVLAGDFAGPIELEQGLAAPIELEPSSATPPDPQEKPQVLADLKESAPSPDSELEPLSFDSGGGEPAQEAAASGPESTAGPEPAPVFVARAKSEDVIPGAAESADPPLIDLLASDADESNVMTVETVQLLPEPPEHSNEPPLTPRAPVSHKPQPITTRAEVTPEVESGEHRIVLHMMDGRVKRGVARELNLAKRAIAIEVRPGVPTEEIPVEEVKAVFFMVPPGGERPPPQGEKIRVMFHDGREIVGYSSDFNASERGFFLIPADTRSNTGRIFLFRWSVHEIQSL